MKRLHPTAVLAAIGCCIGLTAAHAGSLSKEEMSAEKARIEAEYKAQRKTCDTLGGNAKDVCVEEAKGKEKVARAELEARNDASPRQQAKVAEARAEASYAVAKERCDDLSGEQKDVCVKDAKAAKARAEADAKAMSKG